MKLLRYNQFINENYDVGDKVYYLNDSVFETGILCFDIFPFRIEIKDAFKHHLMSFGEGRNCLHIDSIFVINKNEKFPVGEVIRNYDHFDELLLPKIYPSIDFIKENKQNIFHVLNSHIETKIRHSLILLNFAKDKSFKAQEELNDGHINPHYNLKNYISNKKIEIEGIKDKIANYKEVQDKLKEQKIIIKK